MLEFKHATQLNTFFSKTTPSDSYSRWTWHPTTEYRPHDLLGLSPGLPGDPYLALILGKPISQGCLSPSLYGRVSLLSWSETLLLGAGLSFIHVSLLVVNSLVMCCEPKKRRQDAQVLSPPGLGSDPRRVHFWPGVQWATKDWNTCIIRCCLLAWLQMGKTAKLKIEIAASAIILS